MSAGIGNEAFAQTRATKDRIKETKKLEAREAKEGKRNRASWDERGISEVINRLQDKAVKEKGSCNNECIAAYRCLAEQLTYEMSYSDYESTFVSPLRVEDMNAGEKENFNQKHALFNGLLQSCKNQVEAGLQINTTLQGLEFQMAQADSMANMPAQWVEFYRGDNAISQFDQASLDQSNGNNAGESLVKNLTLRQFSTRLNGNYSISKNRYDCTQKTVDILQYVVYSPFGVEMFGDYTPAQTMPMDLANKNSEDHALYLRVCPASAEPEPGQNPFKKKKPL